MPHDAPCREQHLPCAAGQKPASTHRATVKVGPLRCMLRIVETSGTTLMVQPSTPSRWGPWNLRLHCSSKLLAHCGFTANVPPARSSLIQSWKKRCWKVGSNNKKLKNKKRNESWMSWFWIFFIHAQSICWIFGTSFEIFQVVKSFPLPASSHMRSVWNLRARSISVSLDLNSGPFLDGFLGAFFGNIHALCVWQYV